MTARFGRNKRRAAREAVAKAEAAAAAAKAETASTRDYWQKLLYQEQRARHDAQALLGDICERIIRAVGSESALLPIPVQLKIGHRFGTQIRWPLRNEGYDVDGYALAEPRMAKFSVIEENYVALHKLVMDVTEPEGRRYVGKLIRFVDEHSDKGARGFTERAYFASDDALRKLGPEMDFRYFAEEIAHQLLTFQRPEQRK
jgi:hypothetical protein